MSFRSRAARVGLAVVAIGALHLAGETGAASGLPPGHRSAPPTPAVGAAGAVSAPALPQLSDTFAYADTADPNQRLVATWNPALVGAPWVMTVHGGSWVAGGPSGVRAAADLFRRHGFQVFNLRYRLVGGSTAGRPVTYLDQRQDVLTALAWIRDHAGAFGIDPGRGAIYGSSAGGNLALAAGLAGDGTNGIRGIVSVAGVVQPTRLWDDLHHRNKGERVTAQMRRLAGHARDAAGCAYPPRRVAGCAARWRAMDVASAVSPHDPAVLLYQGLADRKVPHRMASAFRARLDRANVGGSLTLVPRLGHTQQLALDGGRRQAAMITFLTQRTSVAVAPGLSRIAVSRPSHRAGRATRVRLTVRVRSQQDGVAVSGQVVAIVGRTAVRARLVRGKAGLRLPKATNGRVIVRYVGSPLLQPRLTTVTVKLGK